MKTGDLITYKTADYHSQFGGKIEGKIKNGFIEEIFDSMDKTFKCFWVKGETELITEKQIIS